MRPHGELTFWFTVFKIVGVILVIFSILGLCGVFGGCAPDVGNWCHLRAAAYVSYNGDEELAEAYVEEKKASGFGSAGWAHVALRELNEILRPGRFKIHSSDSNKMNTLSNWLGQDFGCIMMLNVPGQRVHHYVVALSLVDYINEASEVEGKMLTYVETDGSYLIDYMILSGTTVRRGWYEGSRIIRIDALEVFEKEAQNE